MNLRTILLPTAAALVLAAQLHAQSRNDMIKAEVQTKLVVDREMKGGRVSETKQLVTLQIALSGRPKNPETRTGVWTIYARDVEDRIVTALETGKFTVALSGTGQQKLESTEAAAESTPARVEVTGGGNNPQSKKIPATGVKYIGYSVVIKDGDKVVGELYSAASLKAETAK